MKEFFPIALVAVGAICFLCGAYFGARMVHWFYKNT
jgi:hypothetical protein